MSNYFDHLFLLLDRMARTRYVDAVYVTDQVARFVDLSVCHTSEP